MHALARCRDEGRRHVGEAAAVGASEGEERTDGPSRLVSSQPRRMARRDRRVRDGGRVARRSCARFSRATRGGGIARSVAVRNRRFLRRPLAAHSRIRANPSGRVPPRGSRRLVAVSHARAGLARRRLRARESSVAKVSLPATHRTQKAAAPRSASARLRGRAARSPSPSRRCLSRPRAPQGRRRPRRRAAHAPRRPRRLSRLRAGLERGPRLTTLQLAVLFMKRPSSTLW
mmetsp:Transcript_21544/g.67581  ORF Transcript_21544/g.67581 Transcript_21544/m.67581 type:complete len:231 (+) Transcript_21544:281-973(+)